jgi:hypothetical protein
MGICHTGFTECLLAGPGWNMFHPDPASKQSATTYQYIGTEESEGMQHQQMKERLQREYTGRL